MDFERFGFSAIFIVCLIFLSGCGNGKISPSGIVIHTSGLPKSKESNFNFKYIGEEREYKINQKTGIPGAGFTKPGWYGYDFEVVNLKERKVLNIKLGKERYNHGYIKHARIYDVYENSLSWPKKKYKRFLENIIVEDVTKSTTRTILPVNYLSSRVSIDALNFSGETTPTSDGVIVIDLLEPSLFAKDEGFEVIINSDMYKIGKSKTTKNIIRISNSIYIGKNDVDDMVKSFKKIKSNSHLRKIYIKGNYQALIDSKYVYDRYGDLKIVKDFYESDYYKKQSNKLSKVKRPSLRLPIRLPHPGTLLIGIIIDSILSSGVESEIMFLH